MVQHLDSKVYIIELANYISDDTVSNTLLVGGPKDSRKTKGLVFMLRAARRLGYAVHGFKQQVANGDWDVVFCSLNSTESCDNL